MLSEDFQVFAPLYTCIPEFFLMVKNLDKFGPEKYDLDLYKGIFMEKLAQIFQIFMISSSM
jgi:hypothetical protein